MRREAFWDYHRSDGMGETFRALQPILRVPTGYSDRMGGAASRAKGHRAELEVVHALMRAGWAAVTSRAAAGGFQQGEDIRWDGPLSIEVKDHAALDLAGWIGQAEAQAGDRPPVVVHKRRGKGKAEDWYATMTLGGLLRLIEALREEQQDETDEHGGGTSAA